MDRKHDPEQYKADANAIASGHCPETGRDLRDCAPNVIRAHCRSVFPQFEEGSKGGSDYERRARLIMTYADQREAVDKGSK